MARTLCDELEDLGYAASYQTLTRQIRQRKLHPVCEACVRHRPPQRGHRAPARGGNLVELSRTAEPTRLVGLGQTAYLMVGSLADSERWRGGSPRRRPSRTWSTVSTASVENSAV